MYYKKVVMNAISNGSISPLSVAYGAASADCMEVVDDIAETHPEVYSEVRSVAKSVDDIEVVDRLEYLVRQDSK